MEAKVFVLESRPRASGEPAGHVPRLQPGRAFTGKVAGSIRSPLLSEDSPLKYFERAPPRRHDPELMKPGVQVRASIFVEKLADVIAIPNQAFVFEGDAAFVFIRKGGRVLKRPVEMGARSLTQTVVTKGLEEGAQILLGQPGTAAKAGRPS
jgi:hypothetical protein